MNLYERYGLRHFMHPGTDNGVAAEGPTLEVGIGAALNLPFYDPEKIAFIWGLDPSAGMRMIARKNLPGAPIDVQWLPSPASE